MIFITHCFLWFMFFLFCLFLEVGEGERNFGQCKDMMRINKQ